LYPAEKLYKYPHMLPADVEIWERFLDRHGTEFSGFDYDVHVGGSVERLDSWSDEYYRGFCTLAAKRIDAVGYKPGEVWLFEVKPEAGVTAVGQLVTYRDLYLAERGPVGVVVCCLVCENILPDELGVMDRLGFKVFVV